MSAREGCTQNSSVIPQYIMMADIDKRNQCAALVEPYDPYIHIDAEFKEILSLLNTLCAQGRVQRVVCK